MATFALSLPAERNPSTMSGGRFHALYTYRVGTETRHLMLPVDGCPASVAGDVPEWHRPTAAGEHLWITPINCMAHDDAHLAGIGCENCGEHHFFVKPFCPEEN